jgi:photosystem II stability/assembly factor-like uncharacterized protein
MKKISLLLLTVFCLLFSAILNAQWVRMSDGMGNKWIYSFTANGTALYSCSYNTGVYRSTNYGNNWTAVNNGLTSLTVLYLESSGSNIFVGTGGTTPAGVFRSTDNGEYWAQLNGLYSFTIMGLTKIGNTVFAATNGAGVYSSTDNGDNWNPVNNGLTDLYLRSLTSDGSNLYAGTYSGGVFSSANNGLNWASLGLAGVPIMEIAASSSNIFIGSSASGVYRSTNNGVNWVQVNNGLLNLSISSLLIFGQNIFSSTGGTTPYGAYLSTNMGNNWNNVNQGFDTIPFVMTYFIQNNYIYAGTNKGVWRRNLSEIVTGIKNEPELIPAQYKFHQNYPNPFNPVTTIKFDIPNKIPSREGWQPKVDGVGLVTLTIYDMLGREVAVLVNENLKPGSYSITWDASHYSSGVYFYKLVTEGFMDIRKMVLLK